MIKELMHDSVFPAGFEKMYVADGVIKISVGVIKNLYNIKMHLEKYHD